MKKVLFLTMGVLLLCICQVNAKNEKPYFGIYGAISIPRGDFGDDDIEGDYSGFAKTGFGVGIEHTYPLNSPGLSWVSNVSFILNGVDEDFEETAKDMFSVFGIEDIEVDVGNYINIPIMTGIKYQSEGSPTMSFYGMAQAGLNFLKCPKFEISGTYYDYYYEYKLRATATSDMATSFGFSIGGGIILNKKFIIGLRYLSLGEPDVESTLEVNVEGERGKEKIKAEQPISIILLTIGRKF